MKLDSIETILAYLQAQADGRAEENDEGGCLQHARESLIGYLYNSDCISYEEKNRYLHGIS